MLLTKLKYCGILYVQSAPAPSCGSGGKNIKEVSAYDRTNQRFSSIYPPSPFSAKFSKSTGSSEGRQTSLSRHATAARRRRTERLFQPMQRLLNLYSVSLTPRQASRRLSPVKKPQPIEVGGLPKSGKSGGEAFGTAMDSAS